MSLEEDYRKSTRWLGTLFVAALLVLFVLLIMRPGQQGRTSEETSAIVDPESSSRR